MFGPVFESTRSEICAAFSDYTNLSSVPPTRVGLQQLPPSVHDATPELGQVLYCEGRPRLRGLPPHVVDMCLLLCGASRLDLFLFLSTAPGPSLPRMHSNGAHMQNSS